MSCRDESDPVPRLAAEQQIFHAVHFVEFSRMHVSVEDDDIQILSHKQPWSCEDLNFRDGSHARAGKGWCVKGDDFLGPIAFGLIQPSL